MDITPASDFPTDAQDLIWAFLDEQISDSDFERLEALLQEDAHVRQMYLQCVEMHVGLQCSFRGNNEMAPRHFSGVPLPFDLPLRNDDFPLADQVF